MKTKTYLDKILLGHVHHDSIHNSFDRGSQRVSSFDVMVYCTTYMQTKNVDIDMRNLIYILQLSFMISVNLYQILHYFYDALRAVTETALLRTIDDKTTFSIR